MPADGQDAFPGWHNHRSESVGQSATRFSAFCGEAANRRCLREAERPAVCRRFAAGIARVLRYLRGIVVFRQGLGQCGAIRAMDSPGRGESDRKCFWARQTHRADLLRRPGEQVGRPNHTYRLLRGCRDLGCIGRGHLKEDEPVMPRRIRSHPGDRPLYAKPRGVEKVRWSVLDVDSTARLGALPLPRRRWAHDYFSRHVRYVLLGPVEKAAGSLRPGFLQPSMESFLLLSRSHWL